MSILSRVDLMLTMSDKTYKQIIKAQMKRLLEMEMLVYQRSVPVFIVFEGWDAAGKGTTIRRVTERMDARGFKVLPTQAPRTHEKQRPWLWRFWMEIPRRGQIAIFDRSWYGRVLIERVEGLTPIPEWIRAYEEINAFERTLAADGAVFVKCWLHISRAEQLRRFLLLTNKPETAWQVTAEDWEHHRKYDEYLAAVEDMLENTDTAVAPWSVIPATDPNYRTFAVMQAVIAQLESALGEEASDWSKVDQQVEKKKVEKKKVEKKKVEKKKDGKKAKVAHA